MRKADLGKDPGGNRGWDRTASPEEGSRIRTLFQLKGHISQEKKKIFTSKNQTLRSRGNLASLIRRGRADLYGNVIVENHSLDLQ